MFGYSGLRKRIVSLEKQIIKINKRASVWVMRPEPHDMFSSSQHIVIGVSKVLADLIEELGYDIEHVAGKEEGGKLVKKEEE